MDVNETADSTDRPAADPFSSSVVRPAAPEQHPSPSNDGSDAVELSDLQMQFEMLKDGLGGIISFVLLTPTVAGRFSPEAHHAHLMDIQGKLNTQDPIAKMMIEQLVWSHHHLAALHAKAAAAQNIDAAGIYLAALAKLSGEFRRTSQTLNGLLKPQGDATKPPKQNANKSSQPSTHRCASSGKESAQKKRTRNGMPSKSGAKTNGHVNRLHSFEESTTGGRRKKKSTQKSAAVNGST